MKRSLSISAASGDAVAMLAGMTVTRIGLTGAHRSFVRPSFGPFLVVSGLLVAITSSLRLLGLLRRAGGTHGVDGHSHNSRMPLVSLAFVLPALAFFLAGSATLGSYAANRNGTRNGSSGVVERFFPPLKEPRSGLYFLSLSDVTLRHAFGPTTDIVGRNLRLIGFVAKDEESPAGQNSFTLTRFRILCCAADGIAMRVNVTLGDGVSVPPIDSWVEVIGTFVDPKTPVPENGRFDRALVRVSSMKQIERPADPFE